MLVREGSEPCRQRLCLRLPPRAAGASGFREAHGSCWDASEQGVDAQLMACGPFSFLAGGEPVVGQKQLTAHPAVKWHAGLGAGPGGPVTCGCAGHPVGLQCVPLMAPAGALGSLVVTAVLLAAPVLVRTDQLVVLVWVQKETA